MTCQKRCFFPSIFNIKITLRIKKKIQTFKTDNELPEREMLIKIMNQNKKIINQNKIIIEQLKRLGEKND